jgi:hypothetical protein
MIGIKEAKHSDAFGIIMLFLIMMLSGGNLLLPRSIMYGVVICGYLLYLYRHNNAITKNDISKSGHVFVGLFIFLSLLHMIITRHYISNINAILKLLAGILVYKYYVYNGYEQFINDLSFLLKLFVILGVITLCFVIVTPGWYSVYNATAGGVSRKFYHIGFIFYVSAKFRLNGLFWEPGIYQIYLNIYLVMQFLLFKQKKWIILTLLLIVYTESTTGYIATAIILLYVGFLLSKQHKSIASRVLIGMLFIMVFSYLVLPYVSANVQDKIIGEKAGSFYARQADMIAGYEIVKEHPFIGIGANVEDFMHERSLIDDQGEFSGSNTANRASTNGLFSVLYMYGFPLCIMYLIGIFRQTMMPGHRLLGVIIILLSITAEPLALTPFFLLFLFSGFKKSYYIV